ncbi:MAG: cyanophycinase [Candidatus Njordarchaeota archaeon]
MPYAYLFFMGGNEHYDRDNPLFRNLVKLAGDYDSRIVIVPTASSQPDSTAGFFRRFFRKFDPASVDIAWISSSRDLDSRKNQQLLKDATCIFFTGGDQEKIIRIIRKTRIHDILIDRLDDDVVIAGTSAGAMALTDICILDSENYGLKKTDVRWDYGLGLVGGVIVDTHFIERNRLWRLSHVVSIFPDCVGIGISEDTGLIYDSKRREFEVIGDGLVTVLEPPSYIRYIKDKIEGREFKMSILADGAIFKVGKSSRAFF